MSFTDLSTSFAQQHLSNCLYNASGVWCKTAQELNEMNESNAGALVTKSCTMAPRTGNPEPRYVDLALGSINSMGLPNLGLDFYLDFIESLETNKAKFISVAGLDLNENIKIVKQLNLSKIDFAIELNLSCPNIPGKPQTAYDFDRSREVLSRVFEFNQKPLGVKLPPYFDMAHFTQMADVLNQFPIQFVTCINSVGNGLFVDADNEQVVIKPKNGFGGIGGDYVKPTALANVRMFSQLLNKDIAIIGCGGVKSGTDVFEHILCGATAVQVGTQLMKEGVGVFDRLQKELSDLMQAKSYQQLSDFRGKLKSL